LVQIEQLQAVTMERSVVHSKRTKPQWQPPVKVLLVDINPLRHFSQKQTRHFWLTCGGRRQSRFRAKCKTVRLKKTRQTKGLEPRF
jgi:hypothetical protein